MVRLTDKQKRECFNEISDSLSRQYVQEYFRKIGLSENDIQNHLQDNSKPPRENFYQLLLSWSNRMGRFCEEDRDFLKRVFEEVQQDRGHNDICDRYLDEKNSKMKRNRDVAWLFTSLIRSVEDDEFWTKDIEHEKLQIPDRELNKNRSECPDSTERKYRNLLYWFRNKGLDKSPIRVVIEEIRNAGVQLPERYDEVHLNPVDDGDNENRNNGNGVHNSPVGDLAQEIQEVSLDHRSDGNQNSRFENR